MVSTRIGAAPPTSRRQRDVLASHRPHECSHHLARDADHQSVSLCGYCAEAPPRTVNSRLCANCWEFERVHPFWTRPELRALKANKVCDCCGVWDQRSSLHIDPFCNQAHDKDTSCPVCYRGVLCDKCTKALRQMVSKRLGKRKPTERAQWVVKYMYKLYGTSTANTVHDYYLWANSLQRDNSHMLQLDQDTIDEDAGAIATT